MALNAMDRAAVDHEVGFWKGFVQTPRFLDGWLSRTPTPELQPIVRDFLLHRPLALVLDVGSGVVSLLTGTVPRALLVATDPLSECYAQIFDYAAHDQPAPFPIAAEDLIYTRAFDVVHMSNALDHSQDPALALDRLRAAARPGGWVIVQGFEMESTAMGGAGLHQWDLALDDNALVLSNPASGSRVDLGTADEAHTVTLPDGRRWLIWIQQRPA
jgi:SAM-dependent methyltransferase